jgi:hypothetical protein
VPDNVIIPLDLSQLFCPGFMLAAGPPYGFTTDIVGCWGGALWRTCNVSCLALKAFDVVERFSKKAKRLRPAFKIGSHCAASF